MNDNEFWVATWKIIAVAICILILTAGGCTMNRHYQTRMLIENAKVHPMDAKCAIEGDNANAPTCVLRAAMKEGK